MGGSAIAIQGNFTKVADVAAAFAAAKQQYGGINKDRNIFCFL